MFIKDHHQLVTAFLSTAPKIAVFGVLIRVLVYPFGEIIVDWGKIVILSIFSMLIGSLGALKQNDLKRLMAYSTINHIGFILMGLVPGSEDGVTAICIIFNNLCNNEFRSFSFSF